VKEYYLFAKILSASGSEGFVKINLFTDFPRHLFNLKKVYIDFFGIKKEFLIDKLKRSDDNFLIKFKNFNDGKSTDILKGKEIFIDDKDLIKLPKGHYFIHDLIGSTVLKNNVEIGKVRDVLSLPSNDVYIIKDVNGNEILIPAVHDYIQEFDSSKKILYLRPVEELYDNDED